MSPVWLVLARFSCSVLFFVLCAGCINGRRWYLVHNAAWRAFARLSSICFFFEPAASLRGTLVAEVISRCVQLGPPLLCLHASFLLCTD